MAWRKSHWVILALLAGLTFGSLGPAGCDSPRPAPEDPPPATSPHGDRPIIRVKFDQTPASPQAAPEPTAVSTRQPSAAPRSPTEEAEPTAPAPSREEASGVSADPPPTDSKSAEGSLWFLECPVQAEADVYASQEGDQSPASTQTEAQVASATPDSPSAVTPAPGAASAVSIPKAEPETGETDQAAVSLFTRDAGGAGEGDSAGEYWKATDPDPPQSDPEGTEEPSGVRGSVGAEGRTEGEVYTWQDGDHTRRVLLQADLVVGSDDHQVVRGVGGDPVFVSESSGELMTLPGGVLLVFVPDWSRDQIDTFFAEQGIKQHLVTTQTFTTNAFFLETDPGFPSLELANELAGEDGVLLASPNWQREASTR